MSWNYRVVRHYDELGSNVEFHEIYYEDEAQKVVKCWSGPVRPWGEDLDDLTNDLNHMLEALGKPILEAGDLPKGEDDDDEQD